MAIDKKLYPFGGNNAIQNVVFAVEWGDQLSTGELRTIRALHEDPKNTEFRKTFTKIDEPQMLTINIDGKSMQNNNVNEIGGVHFTRPSTSNVSVVSKALNISRQNCLAVIVEYSRWDTVWPEVRKWIQLVLPTILPTHAVTALGLQYVDVFFWKADPAELNLREMLAENSKLLPKNIFDTPNLWHSHHGYIDKCEANSPYEVLENINVNMLDTNGQRSIQILTSHRAQLKAPIWTYDNFSSGLDQFMPQLHERNKSILRDLLMPEVQAMIKLKS